MSGTKWNTIFETVLGKNRNNPSFTFKPGEHEAKKQLEYFLNNKLDNYPSDRNDPTIDGQSNLSPYLHFGHISAQRVALEVVWMDAFDKAKEDFLEELIIRRELSDNYCFFNHNYDSVHSFPDWAKNSLEEHKSDPRHPTYTSNNSKTLKHMIIYGMLRRRK